MTPRLGRYTLAGKMSAVERIRQVQQKELEEKSAKEATEKLRLQNKNTQDLLFLQELDQIIKDAGIMDQLQEIKDKLLTDGQIFIGNEALGRSIELQWNNRSNGLNYSYHYIRIYGSIFDRDKILITGEESVEIPKEQWSNVKVFEDVVAKSFLKPGFYKYEQPEPIDRVQQ